MRRSLLVGATILSALSCKGDLTNPYNLSTTGPGVLSVSPIDLSQVMAVTPLGYLGPPGHVLPSDHIYISFIDAWNGMLQNADCSKRPIYAAGSGVIDFIMVTQSPDTKVDVQMTKTFHYYYDHILLLPGMSLGTRVSAGQQIATTAGHCPSFDLGTWELGNTLPGLVSPNRYDDQTRYAASPMNYFSPSLRAIYLARVRLSDGVPSNKIGKIDYGIAGKLVGDWFHSSVPVDAYASGSAAWDKTIGFVYDWYDNTSVRISIGGTITDPLLAQIGPGDPDPAFVTTANGLVTYSLYRPGATDGAGWLLVQMTAADRIRVQYFASAGTRPTGFTAAAQDYRR